jgi:uncharacterized protein (DUF983 family)
MSKTNQGELFNSFGEAKKNCDACNKIMPPEQEKTGKYWLCERCRVNYLNNLTVY